MNRLPRRTVIMALMAAFVWTLTLRPLGNLMHPAAQNVSASVAAQATVSRGILRLHILANSDRGPDQAAKLAVRSAILPLLQRRVGDAASATQAEAEARAAAPAIAALATRTLRSVGRPYGARVVVGDAYFPAKSQGTLRLGPGVYAAVTVILGRGQGQNWWCVLFPDMCLANPFDTMSRSEPASAAEVLLAPTSHAAHPSGGFLGQVVHTVLSWL
jgi:stage II sporulation protein R